jgi:hypothetical protein
MNSYSPNSEWATRGRRGTTRMGRETTVVAVDRSLAYFNIDGTDDSLKKPVKFQPDYCQRNASVLCVCISQFRQVEYTHIHERSHTHAQGASSGFGLSPIKIINITYSYKTKIVRFFHYLSLGSIQVVFLVLWSMKYTFPS